MTDELDTHEIYQFAKKIALEEVCPNTHEAQTIYEANMVKALIAFGHKLLTRWEKNKDE